MAGVRHNNSLAVGLRVSLIVVALLTICGCPAAYEPANLGVLVLNTTAGGGTNPAPAVPSVPGFTFSTTSLNLTENGAVMNYTIRLNSEPTHAVMVTVTADTETQVNGAGMTTLTFTTGNWDIAQTVGVTTVDNATYEGSRSKTITHAAASTDADYNGAAISPVAATLADDEKRLFATASSFSGNLDTNSNGNPMPEADALCQADGNKPADTAVWKAMLADGTNRRACTTANCTSPSENIDWVMRPNKRYFRAGMTGTLIMTTNGAGVFAFGTLSASFTGGAEQYWTGLQTDWRTDANTCSLFNSSSMGVSGSQGFGNDTGSAAVRTAISTCDVTFRLVCIEQ